MVRRHGAPSWCAVTVHPPWPSNHQARSRGPPDYACWPDTLLAGWPDTVGYMQARTFATLKPETPLPVTPVPLSSMKV